MDRAVFLGLSATARTTLMACAGSTVIAIAGPPGSGKSTLADALAQRLGDAIVLAMDHYQRMTRMPIDEVERWRASGADLEALPLGPLAEHLMALKEGRSVLDPATRATLEPRTYIVFDTHFGRAHHSTGALIDMLVWLDTPPDVALARNLRGFLRPLLGSGTAAQTQDRLQWICGYLDNYEVVVSGLVHMQSARIRPGADLVIESHCTTHEAVERICATLLATGR